MQYRTRAMPLILAVVAAATVACAPAVQTKASHPAPEPARGSSTGTEPDVDTRYPDSAYGAVATPPLSAGRRLAGSPVIGSLPRATVRGGSRLAGVTNLGPNSARRVSSSRRSSASTRTVAAPAAMAASVLAEVNRERRRRGASSLVSDARLNRAAERYARELAARREIEHVSSTPGLRTFRDRMHASGASARIAGENLARLTAAPGTLPDRTVRAWLRSPGHKANLLDPSWRRTGVGVWLGRDGVWYVVQLYATPD